MKPEDPYSLPSIDLKLPVGLSIPSAPSILSFDSINQISLRNTTSNGNYNSRGTVSEFGQTNDGNKLLSPVSQIELYWLQMANDIQFQGKSILDRIYDAVCENKSVH